jgi:hypothetical protein
MAHPPMHSTVATTIPSGARPLELIGAGDDRCAAPDGQWLTDVLNGSDLRAAGRQFMSTPPDEASTDSFVLLVIDQCSGEIDAFGPLDARATIEELEWLRQDLDHGILANVSFGVVRLQALSAGYTCR